MNRSLCEQGHERGGDWVVNGDDGSMEWSDERRRERRVSGAGERDE